jgi:hypothetical protein
MLIFIDDTDDRTNLSINPHNTHQEEDLKGLMEPVLFNKMIQITN